MSTGRTGWALGATAREATREAQKRAAVAVAKNRKGCNELDYCPPCKMDHELTWTFSACVDIKDDKGKVTGVYCGAFVTEEGKCE